MDPKKLDSQDAFDLVTRRQGKEVPDTNERKDIEEGFGEKPEPIIEQRPAWQRYLFWGTLAVITCALIVSVVSFFWFITYHAEPEVVEKGTPETGPAMIGEAQAKQMIETCLRSFLAAESNEDRLKCVYMPEEEKSSLDIYYRAQGHSETPLWNIELIDRVVSAQGEIWMVIYWDVQRKRKAVSFQRDGDQYLLHWSAMKAFSEMTWEKFIVKRPAGPLMMRCFIRQYEGVLPAGIEADKYRCFLVEDRAGLFSEVAIMKLDASGYSALGDLPKASRHPVTLNLGYRPYSDKRTDKLLTIMSLKHLRWQKLSLDSQLQGLE
ncbi:MAG: hypothetical protein QNL01_06845 [Akkermansiaceae bacterium]|tara:strand:- start:1344 stop:2306 length:963 start_codon:yes stop_codon:yes gene_type:complete